MKLQLQHKPKGFTLVEILVVITILAALGAVSMSIYSYISSKDEETAAKTQIAMMEAQLNEYKGEEELGLLHADDYEEGAFALYQMLKGDFNGDGTTDKGHKCYCDQLVYVAPGSSEKPEGIPYTEIPGKKRQYGILDPWGNFYSYRLGCEQKGVAAIGKKSAKRKKKHGNGLNVDFDIYSRGEDGLGDGLNKSGDNEDNISNVKIFLK